MSAEMCYGRRCDVMSGTGPQGTATGDRLHLDPSWLNVPICHLLGRDAAKHVPRCTTSQATASKVAGV
eukprot:1333284-Amphidinium_carterae.1